MLACLEYGGLKSMSTPEIFPVSAVCIVLASQGYPGTYETGLPIHGAKIFQTKNLLGDTTAVVFHAGTKRNGTDIITSGGRVMSVVGLGGTLEIARAHANGRAGRLRFPNKFRRSDIALTVP